MSSKNKLKKIIFWGTPEFAVPFFNSLLDLGVITAVVTQPAKREGRGQIQTALSPIRQLATANGLSVLDPVKLDDRFVKEIEHLLPATFLVVAYGKIIPGSILELSELPAINIHPSLLPELRGPSPIQAAILGGDKQTGITLMRLDNEIDHGPIMAQKKVAINDNDTYQTLSEKLSLAGGQFVTKYIPRYLAGELKPAEQDHNRATYCELIKTADGQLDLKDSATILGRKIRALNPWPGTYLSWHSKRLKILSAIPVNDKPDKLFSKTSQQRLKIRCGSGSLEIFTVQLEGKKALSSVDFLNGHPEILAN